VVVACSAKSEIQVRSSGRDDKGRAVTFRKIATRMDRDERLLRSKRRSVHFASLRTWISYFAPQATTSCASLLKERRMQILKATGLHRKSRAGA
jgi:hypothetical protein